jgi:hypothetical protein
MLGGSMPLRRDVSPLARPRLVREYETQATRLRELAISVTTPRIKARLLEEAANQERLAREAKHDSFIRI